MSRPSTKTWPLVGRSSPPRICSSVVLPEPEAPTMATRSPADTDSTAPCSTSSVTGPWRKLFETARAASTSLPGPSWAASPLPRGPTRSRLSSEVAPGNLLMTERLRRGGAARTPCRIDGRQRAEKERHAADAQHVQSLHVGRKIAHVVDPRIEELSMQQPLEPADERLQIVRD